MKNISKEYSAEESIFENYATEPVPEAKRLGWMSQGMVWSGVAYCLAMFSVGGMLAGSMKFTSFILAVFWGSLIVAVIGTLIGMIGAKTHLASAFNSRFTLGVKGGKIFGLILAVSLSGWFGYQCYYFAGSIISALKMFGFSGGFTPVWAIIGGVLMMITAVAGLGGITLISNMGVPLLFLIAVLTIIGTVQNVDFSVLQAASANASDGMRVSNGIVIVVGSYITGACLVPDLSRFSKSRKDAVCGCVSGFMVAYPLLFLLGGFLFYAYGTSDPCEVLVLHCGLGIFAPFLVFISTWTTNDYNLYCSVLGFANALEDNMKLPTWLLTLLVGGISTLLGALGIVKTFTFFLDVVSVLIPPVAAVIIADYYFYNRGSGLYDYKNAGRLEEFRVNTCFSALAGIAAGMLCNYGHIGVLDELCAVVPSCLVAMLVSVIVLIIYNTITRSGKMAA